MKENLPEKIVLTLIMVGWWLFLPVAGYSSLTDELCDATAHVTYMWSHANFWHLAGNLFVLWLIKGKMYLAPAIVIAWITSYLPAWSIYGEVGMTVGFSGVLFAIVGIKWGVAANLKRFSTKALPFALIGILIPHLNWCIHFYSMVAGYIYGRSSK